MLKTRLEHLGPVPCCDANANSHIRILAAKIAGMPDDVTVVITSIPARQELVQSRAIPSVLNQTKSVDAIAISIDNIKSGAWTNRNRGVDMVNTAWTAFLDDDDELLPHHIEFLVNFANDNSADVVWGWFEVVGGTDPFPQHRGRQWDVNEPHIFPITALIRTDLIKSSNAQFCPDPQSTGNWGTQDFPFWKGLWDAGAKFLGSDVITWLWHHHTNNTSGLPTRW